MDTSAVDQTSKQSAGTVPTYQIDSAHSSAQFSVRHLMIANVRGEFSKISGTIAFDPANLGACSIHAVITADSISTRDANRDAHLKSPDFFDVAAFPDITFQSTGFERKGDDLSVTGTLTLHGVTHPVVLTVEAPEAEIKDPWGNGRIGATATTKINRKDWGLTWNQTLDAGGFAIGDTVTITLDVEAFRATAP